MTSPLMMFIAWNWLLLSILMTMRQNERTGNDSTLVMFLFTIFIAIFTLPVFVINDFLVTIGRKGD